MKLSVLISILLFITTTLSALHELEHITHDHESDPSCLVYHINDKLSSLDLVDDTQQKEAISFEDIIDDTQVHSTHTKRRTNHSTAPPIIS